MATFDRRNLRRQLTRIIEVAYPPRCSGCGLRGCWVCGDCLSALPLFAGPRCRVCSLPLDGLPCDCRELPEQIDRLWVAGPFDGWLRSAIHSYKFSGETARASHFASLMADACEQFGSGAALTPVPLHPRRKRERGYEQTLILAKAISEYTEQPVFTGLKKKRDTPHQVGLSRMQRSQNLLDAFEIETGTAVPHDVILIDDVMTTGSTFIECARVLRAAGSQTVSAVVIAHGL